MDLQAVIRSQYRAALAMLKQAVEACPEAMWDDPQDQAKFWHVAYHTLFYTHLYLQESEVAFRPWERHVPDAHSLATAAAPYSRAEILEYLAICQQEVDKQTQRLNPGAPSGFEWLPFSKLELQFYTIRHIQQHTGELMERLTSRARRDVAWVGMQPD